MSLEWDRAHRAERLTWCLTTGAYADEATCHDGETGATKVDHDHYDLAVNAETGDPMWRIDPVGTTYLLPDGAALRLSKYDDSLYVEPEVLDRLYPQYDLWTARGGATTCTIRDVVEHLWQGVNLRPGVVRIVLPEQVRPAPGSTYVTPNGETWRLCNYGVNFGAEPFTGDASDPRWVVTLPSGSSTNRHGELLPTDARLVWAP